MDYEIKEALEKQNRAIAGLASMMLVSEKAIIMLMSHLIGCIETQLNEQSGKEKDEKLNKMIDAAQRCFFDSEETAMEFWKKVYNVLDLQAPALSKFENIDKLFKGEFKHE